MKPLAAYVGVEGRGQGSEYHEDDNEPALAKARGAAARPVHQPDQGEGGRSRQRSARQIDSGDLQFLRAIPSVGSEAGNGGCTKTSGVIQQLRGDDDVAKLFEEALIVGTAERRVYRFLDGASVVADRGEGRGWVRTEQAWWICTTEPGRPTRTRSGRGSLSRMRDCSVDGPRGAKLWMSEAGGVCGWVGDAGVLPRPLPGTVVNQRQYMADGLGAHLPAAPPPGASLGI